MKLLGLHVFAWIITAQIEGIHGKNKTMFMDKWGCTSLATSAIVLLKQGDVMFIRAHRNESRQLVPEKKCELKFYTKEGRSVQVTFNDFRAENSGISLKLYETTNPEATYTPPAKISLKDGSSTPDASEMRGRYLTISLRFSTDKSRGSYTFSIDVKSVEEILTFWERWYRVIIGVGSTLIVIPSVALSVYCILKTSKREQALQEQGALQLIAQYKARKNGNTGRPAAKKKSGVTSDKEATPLPAPKDTTKDTSQTIDPKHVEVHATDSIFV